MQWLANILYNYLHMNTLNRKVLHIVRFLLIFFLSVPRVSYAQKTRSFSLDLNYGNFKLETSRDGRGLLLSDILGITYKEDQSAPALPYLPVSVLIGPDEVYTGFSVSSLDTLVATNILLAPNPEPMQMSTHPNFEMKKDDVEFGSTMYPKSQAEYTGTHVSDGYRLLTFLVCPFRYDAGAKSLYFKNGIELTVTTRGSTTKQSLKGVGANMRAAVQDKAINADELEHLYGSVQDRSASREGSDKIRYLIITDESLKPAFETLAEWKNMKGVCSKILTVDSIYSNYTGTTLPEKIKRALKDYYSGEHVGLEYVLLGGDTNIVPARMCYIKCGSVIDTTPADLFYACLDGDVSWDGNGNGVYGEVADSVDISPEIFVSRLPVRTVSDAMAFVNRVVEYERNPKEGFWHNNILMGGCMVDTCFTINGVVMSDTQYKSEKTYNDYVIPNWSGTRVRFYDTATDFAEGASYQFNAENLQEQLSCGYNFVDIETHGNNRTWNAEEGVSYNHSDAASLVNDGYSVLFTTACNTNAFDQYDPCLAEAFMRNHQGGILAYVGCSRSGWYYKSVSPQNPSNQINEDIYDILFSRNETSFGKIVMRGKGDANLNYQDDTAYRWLLFGINPLGDPEMPVFTSEPQTFDSVEVSFANGEVRVYSHVPGCRFCFIDKTDRDFYYVAENNSIAAIRNEDGIYQVCITKPGFVPYIALAATNVYVQNEELDYPVHVFTKNQSFLGANVTNLQNVGPVLVKDRGSMTVKKKGGATLDRGFSVELGGSLEIK